MFIFSINIKVFSLNITLIRPNRNMVKMVATHATMNVTSVLECQSTENKVAYLSEEIT